MITSISQKLMLSTTNFGAQLSVAGACLQGQGGGQVVNNLRFIRSAKHQHAS